MDVASLKELYTTELQETRSLEEQLVGALPRLEKQATHPSLKAALGAHLDETRSQLRRVEEILGRHGAGAREHTDQSMTKLVAEADRWVGMIEDPTLRDAAIIASGQRIEHYEIAVYGTLAAWAKQLGLGDDLETLLAILDEEKQADDKLTGLAKGEVNPRASAAA
jgi:ferritin-like metal-binding protein YciE